MDSSCASTEVVQLNASTLSDPNSLCVPLRSSQISDPSYRLATLVDSGSTHCFIDTFFTKQYDLPTSSVPPIKLRLFDGTSNSVITQSVNLPVLFPTGESMTINFYVTLLNPSCTVVLGYNWLTCYNPLIDWVLDGITFWPPSLGLSLPSTTSFARAAQLPQQKPSVPLEAFKHQNTAPCISMISAAAFMCASKRPGMQCFSHHLSDSLLSAKSASVSLWFLRMACHAI